MKTGFIGAGNMAGAILRGAVASGNFKPEELGAFDVDTAKTTQLQNEIGIRPFNSAEELIRNCDAVVLAVKPKMFPEVIAQIRELAAEKQPLILSIAAGKTITAITEFLDSSRRWCG